MFKEYEMPKNGQTAEPTRGAQRKKRPDVIYAKLVYIPDEDKPLPGQQNLQDEQMWQAGDDQHMTAQQN